MGFAINGQVLNASRVARIQNARSLGEAQQMGLFDWIRDRLRGGVKRAAIEDAFNKLQSVKQSDSSADAHGGLLVHFAILRDAMKPEFASGCVLETSINEAQQSWSYRMQVDGKTLAEGTDLPIGEGQTLTAFQDFQLSSEVGALIRNALPSVDPQKTVNGLQEAFAHINQAHNVQSGTNSVVLLEKSQKIVEMLRKDYPALSAQHLKFDFKPGHESSAGDGGSQAGTAVLTLAGRELIRIPVTDAGVLKSVLMAQAELELKRMSGEQEYIRRDMIAGAIKEILIKATGRDESGRLATIADATSINDGGNGDASLAKVQSDSLYSSANFNGIVESGDGDFTVFFRPASGGNLCSLVLSKKSGLQEKFATANFNNLGDLIFQELAAKDEILQAELPELDRSIMSVLRQDATRNLFSNQADYEQYVADIEKELAKLEVGQTTFGNVMQENRNPVKWNVRKMEEQPYGAEYDRSAIKIQSHLRGFLARKDLAPVNDFGFKVMSQADKSYYFDASKTISHLKTPDNVVSDGPQGGFKTLTHSDERFVQLSVQANDHIDLKATNLLAKELSSFSSVCSGYYVENGTMVARNGGLEVWSEVVQGKVIPLKAFKMACEELNTMHDKQIYMRDIKPANLLINDGIVRHVDLDLVVTPTHGSYALRCGTWGYMTRDLLADRADKNFNVVRKSLKSGDQFALLSSMMVSTAGSRDKAIYADKSLPGEYGTGIRLKKFHVDWIKQHVRPEYHVAVRNFLEDPSLYTLKAPLHEMINWNS